MFFVFVCCCPVVKNIATHAEPTCHHYHDLHWWHLCSMQDAPSRCKKRTVPTTSDSSVHQTSNVGLHKSYAYLLGSESTCVYVHV